METPVRQENTSYCAALYMRLSKDDEGDGESVSITTQRKMLRAYATENHYDIYDEYVDDGISGTTFERPAFLRMIRDIENKRVNMVITKDLSRLGRDYILTGQYTEIYFPSKKVRYIAVNDSYDSSNLCTDIAPFKNVINEMYARDISTKIRSAFYTRMKEGAFVGAFAPYGYKRDPADKHHLIIDETPAKIVKEIFQKAACGTLPIQIARELNRRGIPTPIKYRRMQNPSIYPENSTSGEWTSSTIAKMLKNIVYLGHMAQGKTQKISFKSTITVSNPMENWFIVENTHEALVSREIFYLASRRSKQRTCTKKGQFNNLFSGIAKCADCGRNMSTVGTRKKNTAANLACGRYKLYGRNKCSNHFIAYNVLYQIVLSSVEELVHLSPQDEQDILHQAQLQLKRKQPQTDTAVKSSSLKKRIHELDMLIEKLYEDYADGVLSSKRRKTLLGKYEAESVEITAQLTALKENRDTTLSEENSMSLLKQTLSELTSPVNLTPELLYLLIDHIEIGQGVYTKNGSGKIRNQSVKIFFRFAGIATTKTYSF